MAGQPDEIIWFHDVRNGQYHVGGATVPQKRELFAKLAAHLTVLAAEVRTAATSGVDSDPGGGVADAHAPANTAIRMMITTDFIFMEPPSLEHLDYGFFTSKYMESTVPK